MGWEKTTTTDSRGFSAIVGQNAGRDYRNTFGMNLDGLLKPFSTNFNSTGYSHYSRPVSELFDISYSGAAYYLNPFGQHTLHEGILWGDNLPRDINSAIDPQNARPLGIKNPTTFVGWGFDTFGYPVPNYNNEWSASGVKSSTPPSTSYMGGPSLPTGHGRDVPSPLWQAGPLDIRWDVHRKVWTGNFGVFPARIKKAYISGSGTSVSHDSFAENITYDVEINDGPTNRLSLTGVFPCSPRPELETYKVKSLASGSYCFIVNHFDDSNLKPQLRVWLNELPYTTACGGSSATGSPSALMSSFLSSISYYNASTDGAWYSTSKIAAGTALSSGFLNNPIPTRYGGTGRGSYASGYILISVASGELGAFKLQAGTGISIGYNPLLNSGTLTIGFHDSVNFNFGGVNTTITALSGLQTPLSLGQGGTGASGKTFVDLTSTQVISGVKQFSNQLRLSNGTAGGPGIAFTNDAKTGLAYSSGLGLVSSGIFSAILSPTGTRITGPIYINNQYYTGGGPMIKIKNFDFHDGLTSLDILHYINASGVPLFRIDNSGFIGIGGSGSEVVVRTPTGLVGNYEVSLPSNSGKLALVSDISGFTGNIPLGHPTNPTGTRTLIVLNGLISSYFDT